jgi:hypothetical protein
LCPRAQRYGFAPEAAGGRWDHFDRRDGTSDARRRGVEFAALAKARLRYRASLQRYWMGIQYRTGAAMLSIGSTSNGSRCARTRSGAVAVGGWRAIDAAALELRRMSWLRELPGDEAAALWLDR